MKDNGGELAERVVTRCGQLGGLLRERGEVVCPLEAIHDQVGSVVSSEFEGASAADRYTESLGGYRDPGTLRGDTSPNGECPGVCVHECVKMRAATHA